MSRIASLSHWDARVITTTAGWHAYGPGRSWHRDLQKVGAHRLANRCATMDHSHESSGGSDRRQRDGLMIMGGVPGLARGLALEDTLASQKPIQLVAGHAKL